MPKRIRVRKVPSEAVQGPDSFVMVRNVPFGMVLEALDKRDGSATAAEEKEFTVKLFTEAIAEWNWVDNDDGPLLTPAEGLDIDDLLITEIEFLVDSIMGASKAKNSR